MAGGVSVGARVRRSLQENGLRGSVAAAYERFVGGRLFDLRHGTDTAGIVPLDTLHIGSSNRRHGVEYAATSARDFQKVIGSLELPAGSVFVDFGCGKGRTLLLAARSGFQRVVGIDFSAELCGVARDNAVAYGRRHGRSGRIAPIEVYDEDAVEHRFEGDENVFYFFNPFGPDVFDLVLSNIERSLVETPRRAWIIYSNPKHRHLVERRPAFGHVGEYRSGNSRFALYATGERAAASRARTCDQTGSSASGVTTRR